MINIAFKMCLTLPETVRSLYYWRHKISVKITLFSKIKSTHNENTQATK